MGAISRARGITRFPLPRSTPHGLILEYVGQISKMKETERRVRETTDQDVIVITRTDQGRMRQTIFSLINDARFCSGFGSCQRLISNYCLRPVAPEINACLKGELL